MSKLSSISLQLSIAAFLPLCALTVRTQAASADEVLRKVQGQVVEIEIVEKGQVNESFSGIVTDRGKIAIPCENLLAPGSARIRSGASTREARVTHRDILRNLCLLEAEGLDLPPVEIADIGSVSAGARVYAIGNALGMGLAVSEGVVSAVRTVRNAPAIQFTAAVAPGSEGGGLFNENGQLIGVIRYRKLDGQNVNFAAPAEWLKQIAARSASQGALAAARDIAGRLVRDGKWDELAGHARARLEVARDDIDAWRWLAYAQERRKNYRDARDAYKEILALEPDDINAALGSGWAQYELADFGGAHQAARAGLVQQREDARLWLLAAFAEIALKRPEDARKSLEAAVAADPWNPQAAASLAIWARDTGDRETAVAMFRMQTRLQPEKIEVWIDLANSYADQSRFERALAAAEKALSLNAADRDALFQKGRVLSALGRHAEGIEVLKQGLEMKSGRPPVWGWYWLATAYRETGLHAESVAAYGEALRIDPKWVLARQWLAWTLQESGYFDEALVEIENVAKEHPGLPWVWRRRGSLFAALGQHAKAIPDYERSLAIDPKQPWVWRSLIEANRREGRDADARRAYERLRDIDRREAEIAYRENFLPFETAAGTAR